MNTAADPSAADFESLTKFANNLSLESEYAADLKTELLALGATEEEATKYSISSTDRIPLVMAQGRTMNFCKGCGQETSIKRPHKCHAVQRMTFARQLRTDGWAGAFASFRRRGWVPDMNPDQVRKARSDISRSGAPARSMLPTKGERAAARTIGRQNALVLHAGQPIRRSVRLVDQASKLKGNDDAVASNSYHYTFGGGDFYRPDYERPSVDAMDEDGRIFLEPRAGPVASYDSYRPMRRKSTGAVETSNTPKESEVFPTETNASAPIKPQRHLERKERRREMREKAAAKQAEAQKEHILGLGPQSMPVKMPPYIPQQQLPALDFNTIQGTFNQMSLG
jgi:hypothetical protein